MTVEEMREKAEHERVAGAKNAVKCADLEGSDLVVAAICTNACGESAQMWLANAEICERLDRLIEIGEKSDGN